MHNDSHNDSTTSRRGFLATLAALIGAKVVKDALPAEPPRLPIVTSGYSTVIRNDTTATVITTNAAAPTHWNEYVLDPAGDGIRWNYTAGQVQS